MSADDRTAPAAANAHNAGISVDEPHAARTPAVAYGADGWAVSADTTHQLKKLVQHKLDCAYRKADDAAAEAEHWRTILEAIERNG